MEWDGVVAAIDGSVDRKTETMGAGFVVGVGPQPDDSCFFPVGGPLAPLRAEAAGLDGLLDRVEPDRPLLVFTDCLILLMLLLRWGRVDFWPDPEDVKHFDVIGSCLQKLRKRTGRTRLVKVKSHSGLLMRAVSVRSPRGGRPPGSLISCAFACGRVFEKPTRASQMIMFLIRC